MGRKPGSMPEEEKARRWPQKYKGNPLSSGCPTITIPVLIIPEITTDTVKLERSFKEWQRELGEFEFPIVFSPDKNSLEKTAVEIREALSQALKVEEVSPFEALWYIADMQKAILEELQAIRKECKIPHQP